MTLVTVHEVARAIAARYAGAGRAAKGRILDEFCETTGLHRKAAIRLLGRGVRPAGAKKKGRPVRYGPQVVEALRLLWEAGDRMCGKLLAAVIADLLAALERHEELRVTSQVRQALLSISPATIDRLLRPSRQALGRQPRRQSPPTTSLKAQIPIRTWSEWREAKPGSLQADLVLHCGESTDGFFLTTLTTVDVATGWTELQPVYGMGKERIRAAIHHTRQRLPFPLRELHTDNGSEFINHTLRLWCLEQKISCTRGRGYHKNDQAYVEQRNWLGVRRPVGYDRYNSRPAHEAMERLYALLRLQLNFFRPVSKLVSKERRGARVTKRYDTPKTPYQRLRDSGLMDDLTRAQLDRQLQTINPLELQRRIDQALRRLWSLTARREELSTKTG